MRFFKKPGNKAQDAVAVPEQATAMVLRQEGLLGNVAAEFVEVRAGKELCRRATGDLVGEDQVVGLSNQAADDGNAEGTGVLTPEFVPALDRFMPKNEALKYEYLPYI